VTLNITACTDGTAPIPGFTPAVLDFISGNGQVCDALECAAVEMKKGETAVLTCTNCASQCVEEQLGLKAVTAAKVVFTVRLDDFEKAKDTWDMDEEAKLAYGEARKKAGGEVFKKARYHLALQRYKKVIDLFGYIDKYKADNKTAAKELKKLCELNSAMCQIKVKDYADAKKTCTGILKDDTMNVKALYRRAQAELGLKNFIECMQDLKKVLTKDPQNRDARALYKEAQAGQKVIDQESKEVFKKMCGGLGKGPIPEPGKAPKEEGSEDEEEEDFEERFKGAEADAAMPASE